MRISVISTLFLAYHIHSRAETCNKGGDADPFGSTTTTTEESGGCGCSGTSGGLKRDSALGSVDGGGAGSGVAGGSGSGSGAGSGGNAATTSSGAGGASTTTTTTATTTTRGLSSDQDTPSSLYEANLDQMVYIEGGSFYMGTDSPLIKTDGEGPRRLVTLSDFMMDKFEVSNEVRVGFVGRGWFNRLNRYSE
jgi:hypothetical protein